MEKIRICHSADWHINLRGLHTSRLTQIQTNLDTLYKSMMECDPHFIILTGDMFDCYDVTADEQLVFINFVNRVLKNSDAIIIMTIGNHEIKQSKNSFDDGTGQSVNFTDPLKVIYEAISHDNLYYFNESKYYEFGRIVFSNWNHLSKYSIGEENYNPHIDNTVELSEDQFLIETYHDPVRHCKNFDGQDIKGHEKHASINQFIGDLILAGDIHAPYITENESGNFFTYCGSPFVCNFGEGDYYKNTTLDISSNNRHGYNFIILDIPEEGKPSIDTIKFMKIEQYCSKVTFHIDSTIDVSDIESFNMAYTDTMRHDIRIISESHKSDSENIELLIDRLQRNYVVNTIDVDYTKVQHEIPQDHINMEEIEYDYDFMMELARKFIERKFTVRKFKDEELRNEMISNFMDIFSEQIQKINLNFQKSKVTFGKLDIDHFLSFGKTSFDFTNIPDLLRIGAGNGFGKTNMYKALMWLICGKISKTQNSAHSKSNNMDYFNDKVDVDSVFVSIPFKINEGQTYTLVRRLNRTWKKGKSRYQERHWRKHISKVTETVEVFFEDGSQMATGDVDAFLLDTFGTYEAFTDMHLVDDKLISSIIDMNPRDLIEFILNQLGVTFFTQLQKFQSVVNEKYLDGLTKPNIDMVTANENVVNIEGEFLKYLDSMEGIDKIVENLESKLETLQNEINTGNIKKHTLNEKFIDYPEELITDALNIAKENIKSIKDKVELAKSRWDDKQKALYSDTLESVNDIKHSIKSIGSEISLEESKKNTKNAELHNLETEIKHINDNIKLLRDSKISTIKDEFNEVKNTRNDIKSQIDNIQSTIIDSYNDGINTEVDKITNTLPKYTDGLTKFTSKLAVFNNEKSNLITKIEGIQSKKYCTECEREYDDINIKEANIKALKAELVDVETNITKYEKSIKLVNKKIDDINSSIEVEKGKLITEFDGDMIQFTKDERFTITDEHINLIKEYKTLNKELKSIKERFEKAKETIIDEDSKSKISELNKSVSEVKQSISYIDTQINKISSSKATNEALLKEKELIIIDCKDRLKVYESVLESQSSDLEKANKELYNAEKDRDEYNIYKKHLAENIEIDESLVDIKSEYKRIGEEIKTKRNDIYRHAEVKTDFLHKIDLANNILSDVRKYTIAKSCTDAYRDCVGKKGLQLDIFRSYAIDMNITLADVLSDYNFRVLFDDEDDYKLKMIDLVGSNSVRPLYLISGMEQTMSILALIYATKLRKMRYNSNIILIDEISGSLNDGKDADEKVDKNINKNYQMLFLKFLNMVSKTNKVVIVDHVIKEGFTHEVKIVKDRSGVSKFGVINKV